MTKPLRLAALLLLTALTGCGTTTTTPATDAGHDAGSTIVDAGTDLGVDAGVDAGVDLGLDASVDAGNTCVGTNACWQCAPTTNAQFLNHCTTSMCAPFDNVARIPNFVP